ncbi:MAG: TerB family tellurite resistance protein [Nannocystaceae bacterium]
MAADTGLSSEEIEVFARGLYHLANVDGIEKSEEDLISEFLAETGAELTFADLKETNFSAYEAAQILEASFLRRIFVKAAIALVKADGVFSDAERRALGEIADVFGLSNAEFGDLEQEAARQSLA